MLEDVLVVIAASFPMPHIFLKEDHRKIGELARIDAYH
jgi:hypothetical protein